MLKRENSQLKQDDLAARFGVERSTVSKILKDAARWMNPAAWVPEKRKESIAPTSVPCVFPSSFQPPPPSLSHPVVPSPADERLV